MYIVRKVKSHHQGLFSMALLKCHGCGIFFDKKTKHVRFKVLRNGGGVEPARQYCSSCTERHFGELIANGYEFTGHGQRKLALQEASKVNLARVLRV
jgi:hypothetical protein